MGKMERLSRLRGWNESSEEKEEKKRAKRCSCPLLYVRIGLSSHAMNCFGLIEDEGRRTR